MKRLILSGAVSASFTAAISAALVLFGACAPETRSFTPGTGGATASSGGAGGSGATGGSGGADTPDASDDPDAALGPPETLASGLDDPYSIAVDDQSVFVVTSSTLLRVSTKNDAAPVVLAEGLAPPSSANPYVVAVDANFVHWFAALEGASSRFYFSCPAAGCFGLSPKKAWDAPLESPTQLSQDEKGVVRISQKFDIAECSGGTCAATKCVSADSIRSFVVDGVLIYWAHTTDPGGVYFCAPMGRSGPIQLHAEYGGAMAIVGDMHYVMNVPESTIFACNKTGCGGNPTAFIKGEAGLTSMAADATGVYWTTTGGPNQSGSVKMCPLSGCDGGPRVIASKQTVPTSITLRGAHVYWANHGGAPMTGEVMRAHR